MPMGYGAYPGGYPAYGPMDSSYGNANPYGQPRGHGDMSSTDNVNVGSGQGPNVMYGNNAANPNGGYDAFPRGAAIPQMSMGAQQYAGQYGNAMANYGGAYGMYPNASSPRGAAPAGGADPRGDLQSGNGNSNGNGNGNGS